jgi:2-dehydro-3-deoxy-D-gluconate 5-dehydrogenase
MKSAFDLSGKVAIVTGGNGGIGLGMAKGLASAGATIAIFARNKEKNAEAVATLSALGVEAEAYSIDVTNETAVKDAVAAVEKRFGSIHILVNNAGINKRKLPQDYSLAEWHQIMDANLTSAFVCSNAVHPAMKRAGGGKIIATGSMASVFGNAFSPVYSASKGGLVQLCKSLAMAWAPDNIQVNAILPGYIETDLVKAGLKEAPHTFAQVLPRTPAGRWGQPEDFAGVAVFLASAASDFITGASIPVDGGYLIRA